LVLAGRPGGDSGGAPFIEIKSWMGLCNLVLAMGIQSSQNLRQVLNQVNRFARMQVWQSSHFFKLTRVHVGMVIVFLMMLWLGVNRFSPNEPTQARTAWYALWNHYQAIFITADGRVIDPMRHNATTSEGQSYAMFFALVAQDRPLFDRLLQWTQNNLSQGDFSQHLPAWLWGENAAHHWGVLEQNDASDANLWIAFSLLNAGNQWPESTYTAQGLALLDLIAQRDGVRYDQDSFYLLPGAKGFILPDGKLVLNPSYFPMFQLAYFAHIQPKGPWSELQNKMPDLIRAASPKGFVPDWFAVDPRTMAVSQAPQGVEGGYDAIRVYLWFGLSAVKVPKLDVLNTAMRGMASYLKENPTPLEWINTQTAELRSLGNSGFKAALIPFLKVSAVSSRADEYQSDLINEILRHGLISPDYYANNLALFALTPYVNDTFFKCPIE
jgi:endoglucanase